MWHPGKILRALCMRALRLTAQHSTGKTIMDYEHIDVNLYKQNRRLMSAVLRNPFEFKTWIMC